MSPGHQHPATPYALVSHLFMTLIIWLTILPFMTELFWENINIFMHLQGSFWACTSQWETTLQCNVISHWLGALPIVAMTYAVVNHPQRKTWSSMSYIVNITAADALVIYITRASAAMILTRISQSKHFCILASAFGEKWLYYGVTVLYKLNTV